MTNSPSLKAVTFIATLKPSPADSSSEKIARDLAEELERYDISMEYVRAVDYTIAPGVEADMGDGDEWPMLRQKILDADIFILSTPTWMGHMSSVAMRILERLDAELSDTDDKGRLLTFGKVAAVAVVGNEDGAHSIIADSFQALNDVGFTIPAHGATYWNGEAMHKTDYQDLDSIPEKVLQANKTLAQNVAHLAGFLSQHNYPGEKDEQ